MDQNKVRITIKNEARAEIEEKKSVFIGSIAPVSDETAARDFIDRIKKEFYDARHNVFAYILEGGMITRFTDDGEPKGSAGIPILNVLKMSGVDGVCLVVTRYFGGILLGTGGLARAYSAAAKAALDSAGITVMSEYAICEISCSYSDYTKISAKISSAGAILEDSIFETDVSMIVSCLLSSFPLLKDLVIQISNGKCEPRIIKTEERPQR